ncbi:hypothetical protein EVAR_70341_1, partial [Eumeta japonica]
IQLRRERTEERRKVFQIADTRRRVGSAEMDTTPFARWKKALPSLTLSKSIDSDDRKPNSTQDGEYHEALPREILEIKDIGITKDNQQIKNKSKFEFKQEKSKLKETIKLHEKSESSTFSNEDKALAYRVKKEIMKRSPTKYKFVSEIMTEEIDEMRYCEQKESPNKMLSKKQISDPSAHTNQSDSIGSVIPLITISATESDDEILQTKIKKAKGKLEMTKALYEKKYETTQSPAKNHQKGHSELKLRRQSSVDSINEQKPSKTKKAEEGPKYQYSL